MSDLVTASVAAEADAVERIRFHHDILLRQFDLLHQNMVECPDAGGASVARDILVDWCEDVLLAHAHAEEVALYPSAREIPETKLLVEAIHTEHAWMAGLVAELARADDASHRDSTARVLATVLRTHLQKESDHLAPGLAAAESHSLAVLIEGIEDVVGYRLGAIDHPAVT